MLREVTIAEINRILEVTDQLGVHRESVVIPLAPRHPGRVRRLPGGKVEIVVESQDPFETWLEGLESAVRGVLA